MTEYRRYFQQGGTYFFTVNLHDRSTQLLTENIDYLRQAFRLVMQSHPFQLDAMVVLPEHLHCIWILPENDANFSTRWRQIKSHFSRQLPKDKTIRSSRASRKERGIWQRRFWEHAIVDENDYRHHVDYIHYNPVKHGYCESPEQWPHSSFKKFVKKCYYSAPIKNNTTKSNT